MLSDTDLQELESSLLPALERHHLRLLAHSLRCLQAASTGEQLPELAALQTWAQQQPGLVADPAFIPVLIEQLLKAGVQLEAIAAGCGVAPLALGMADLVAWGRASADARLAAGAVRPPHN